jgi:transcriptional regulator with XRE-family HTH domain
LTHKERRKEIFMVRWKLRELIAEYQAATGDMLRQEDIANATGLSQNTLSLIATNKARRADLATIDSLLRFLSPLLKRELIVSDLLTTQPAQIQIRPTPAADRLRDQERAKAQATAEAEAAVQTELSDDQIAAIKAFSRLAEAGQ